VVRDRAPVQQPADVDPGGDVPRASRAPREVEREVRLGPTLAGADEDERAAVGIEPRDLVGE
jgi:hypothetical protein